MHRTLVAVARRARASRRAQIVVLGAALSMLIAIASTVPLLTTSIGRAMVDHRVAELGEGGRSVEVRAVATGDRIPISRLAPVVGDQWDGLAGPIDLDAR